MLLFNYLFLSSISCIKRNNKFFTHASSSIFNTGEYHTVGTAYLKLKECLQHAGDDEAHLSARYFLSDVATLGYRQSDFYENLHIILDDKKLATLEDYYNRRVRKEPVQYIIGSWDFYGYNFTCKPPVLIPRPETEELVQKILESKILNDIDCPHILDIGAGTGIIGITLLMQLKNNNARCTSIDINKVAVNLANENACTIMKDQECGTYSCLHSSFEDFIKICHESSQKFDLIVSNPPYIPSEEMVTLQDEVKLYEDHQALHGGEYGLDLVYDIINSSEDLLTETGTKEIWMEVSRSHPVVISRWLSKQPSPSLPHIPQNHLQYRGHFQMIEELVDWSGHPRFVRLKCTK